MIGAGSGDVVTGTGTTLNSNDIIIDVSSGDGDTLNVTTSSDIGAANAATVVGIESVNFTMQSFTGGGDNEFDIDASGIAASTITIDLDQTGTSVVSTSITGVATGSSVIATGDFTTAVAVSGDDNAAITVNAAAPSIQATSGAGALTSATMTGTLAGSGAVTRFDTNSDAAAVMTTTASDLEIDAIAATSVTANSSGSIVADNSADATTENLTAATTVSLTAADEIVVEMTAATSATLSAGFGDAAAVTESLITGAALTTLNLSGNGSAPRFDTTAAAAVRTIDISGSQNVTVEMDLSEVSALTTPLAVTDSSTATSRVILGTANAGVATNLSGVAADVIELAIANTRTLTFASGAAVTISADQAAGTYDGADATAATNTLALTLNDGDATAGAADLAGVTITDFGSVTIDASVDAQVSTITSLTASADNTDVTINAGARGVTLATAVNLGTGDLVISSTAAVAGGATAITANSLTVSGNGAVTLTAINSSNLRTVTTGAGNDALTVSATGASLTLNTGDGTNSVTMGASTTAAMTYTIAAGSGFDTFAVLDGTNVSSGTLAITGFERVRVTEGGTGNGSAVTVSSSLLNGQSYIMNSTEPTGDGDITAITVTLGTGVVSGDYSSLIWDATWGADDTLTVTDTTGANITLTGATDISNIFTTGSGNDTLTGGDAGDTLDAGNGVNTINGGAGEDSLTGGTGVDTINGGDDDDQIAGGTGNDVLTGGEGADNITGSTGADSIVLTETTSAADTVDFDATSDGSAVGVASGTFSGFDVITGFRTANDTVVFDNTVFSGATGANGGETVLAGTAASIAAADLTIAEITDVDQVLLFVNDSAVVGNFDAAEQEVLAVTFTGLTALYSINDADSSGTIEAGEIVLIGTVDAVLTAGMITV